MPKVNPDFSEDQATLEPGVFLCKILTSEVKVGKSSGNPYVNWKLQVMPNGPWVFHSTPLEGRGSGMFKHMVHCAGDKDYNEGEYDTDELKDRLVSMDLDTEVYTKRDGTEAMKYIVMSVNPPSLEELEKLNEVQNKLEEDIEF